MTCKELVELVTDYLEGRLPPAEVRRFDEHLELCPGCVTYVEQIRATVAVSGRLAEEDMPEGAADALLAEFRDWKLARGV
jgi:anti-sigma factor RsiW